MQTQSHTRLFFLFLLVQHDALRLHFIAWRAATERRLFNVHVSVPLSVHMAMCSARCIVDIFRLPDGWRKLDTRRSSTWRAVSARGRGMTASPWKFNAALL